MRPGEWQPAGHFLDTASYGLPPRVAWDALQSALADWRGGTTSWEVWAPWTERAREAFARLVGVSPDTVAVGATVSELVSLLADAVPPGSRILTAEGDFTSLLFPWAARGHVMTAAPLAELADSVEPSTDVVAVSLAQSATGEVVDLDAVVAAARAVDALVVVDGTQACGWLPVRAGEVDALVCAGYKWLLAPRGTAYLALGERVRESARPLHAGWWAGDDLYGSAYGLPLRLASTARRLDTSPAWFSWVGAAPALELLLEIGADAIHEHAVALANRFRSGLGLEPSNSAIVRVDMPGAAERLEAAEIRAAVRAGSLRAAFHLYNTDDDVDAALAALLD
jgi:selenocysteine lyase/cysteine desulfurase